MNIESFELNQYKYYSSSKLVKHPSAVLKSPSFPQDVLGPPPELKEISQDVKLIDDTDVSPEFLEKIIEGISEVFPDFQNILDDNGLSDRPIPAETAITVDTNRNNSLNSSDLAAHSANQLSKKRKSTFANQRPKSRKAKSPKVKKSLVKKNWTKKDLEALQAGIMKFGSEKAQFKNISEIFLHMKFTKKQCYHKYLISIVPKCDDLWSNEERQTLLHAYKIHPADWEKISCKYFKGKRKPQDCKAEYGQCVFNDLRNQSMVAFSAPAQMSFIPFNPNSL